MSKLLKLLKINLRLFDGGEAGAGSPTGSTGAATQTETNKPPVNSRQAKQGEKIVYGKQPESEEGADGSTGSDGKQTTNKGSAADSQNTLTPEQRKAEFEKLISGDYKDLFTERTQNIIDRRFRDTKILEGRFGSLQPALDILMSRYNVESEKDLADAILKDDAYLQDAADEAGMSVEQYRKYLQTESENRRLKEIVQDTEARRQGALQYGKWENEVAELKGTKEAPGKYPNIDLAAESTNTQFRAVLDSLTRAGFPNPVQKAYETIHMEEITAGIAASTAKKVGANITENLKAKGNRPVENGTNNQSGVIVKNDVRQLTKEDRLEIAKRSQRGEKITF